MKLTSPLFEAYLKCPTKCYLRSTGLAESCNAYADWVREQNDAYRKEGVQRLMAAAGDGDVATTPGLENLKTATWRLAVDLPLETETMASRLHAVERVASEGRGRPAQFIPVRFVFFNKLTNADRLLVAFDALVLSEVLGREVGTAKIIHGDDQSVLNVKVASVLEMLRKVTANMSAMLSSSSAPDLVLNRHCGECEYRDQSRQKAIEKDDLSLLAGMSAKERQRLRNKGVFTVTQLSYTFRPRRRPKRLRDKREKYHHALKALAIREKKIHIVGSPGLKIEGTPVYLDVEGLPDRDFYYLIGLRVGSGESAVQHSLWADTVADEGKIWREFLAILGTVEKPLLVHYGSYEATFLCRMAKRYGGLVEGVADAQPIPSTLNLLSFIYDQIYFPTYSNGLKDIGTFIGFTWPRPHGTGPYSIMWRQFWEKSVNAEHQENLVAYNSADCEALEMLSGVLGQLLSGKLSLGYPQNKKLTFVMATTVQQYSCSEWQPFVSPIPALEEINQAAYWDYQRDRIYLRKAKKPKIKPQRAPDSRTLLGRPEKLIVFPENSICPKCGGKSSERVGKHSRILNDLLLGRSSIKRRVVRHEFQKFRCATCGDVFGPDKRFYTTAKFGRTIIALFLYLSFDVRIAQQRVAKVFDRLFNVTITTGDRTFIKEKACEYYQPTMEALLKKIVDGRLVHVDETEARSRTKLGYVWIFTNAFDVVYLYSESRESDILRNTLRGFKGVLISDFYAAYDSIDCPQQKCLIHLIRNLNDELLSNPYDEELKQIVHEFADFLRAIIETIDRYGLKRHWLKKHHQSVDRFYKRLGNVQCRSDAALKCKQRFEKNCGKLFTFLDYDEVPWNNNAAEHAAKSYGSLREMYQGTATPKSLRENLVFLSIGETCSNRGIDFLNFLRSGETDIYAFGASRLGRRRRHQPIQPANLPADEANQK